MSAVVSGLPASIMVHVAVPVEYDEPQTDPPEWIEGEPGAHGGGDPTMGVAFACVLFLPLGGEQSNAYRPKTVKVPTLLYNPVRDDLTPVLITNESELLITAPELATWTGAETARWLAVGDGQPFGPPGTVIGVQSTLRQVRD